MYCFIYCHSEKIRLLLILLYLIICFFAQDFSINSTLCSGEKSTIPTELEPSTTIIKRIAFSKLDWVTLEQEVTEGANVLYGTKQSDCVTISNTIKDLMGNEYQNSTVIVCEADSGIKTQITDKIQEIMFDKSKNGIESKTGLKVIEKETK